MSGRFPCYVAFHVRPLPIPGRFPCQAASHPRLLSPFHVTPLPMLGCFPCHAASHVTPLPSPRHPHALTITHSAIPTSHRPRTMLSPPCIIPTSHHPHTAPSPYYAIPCGMLSTCSFGFVASLRVRSSPSLLVVMSKLAAKLVRSTGVTRTTETNSQSPSLV
jgi:hypothetical protein